MAVCCAANLTMTTVVFIAEPRIASRSRRRKNLVANSTYFNTTSTLFIRQHLHYFTAQDTAILRHHRESERALHAARLEVHTYSDTPEIT